MRVIESVLHDDATATREDESDEQIRSRVVERFERFKRAAWQHHVCDLSCANHREHMAAIGITVD